MSESSQLSCVFHIWSRGGCVSLGGSSNARLCVPSVRFVFVFGVFHCFLGGSLKLEEGHFSKVKSHLDDSSLTPLAVYGDV